MKKFKEGGLGGVFIHPRPGLITEYLSEDWNHLYDYTISKAKELGMKVWIYDENSYPSGFAGGHVPAEMPDSYSHGTGISCETQEVFKPDTCKYEVILKMENNDFKNITDNYKSEVGAKGKYFLFKKTYSQKSYWYGNYPYVDLLYKGVTQKFMEITMKGYEKYNKADFGKTLMGIFTDEPNLEAAMDRKSAFRWTPDMYTEFQKRWGYDLKINFPSLVEEVGNWKKVRHDYYVTLLEMFLDRWSKPWNKYCEENGLAWTGHYWEHGWPRPTEGIDEAAFYIYHQQPGIDMLGNELIPGGKGGQFGNTRAVRELLSATNQGGHLRTLSETYGGAGWEINFTNFKRLVDWQGVLGVNFVNQHLSYFSMKGVRKFDYPPSFSYHEPWWSDYKSMGDYIGRICLATASGQQINKTLVLQPNTSAWMYFSRKVKNAVVDSIQEDFKTFIYKLERNHFEYDLGSENVLKTIGSVKGGHLVVGKRTYNLVVIPKTMESVDNSTYKLLKEFLANGGKVLSFTQNIPCIDGAEVGTMKELMNSTSKQWIFANKPDDLVVKELFALNEFSISDASPKSGELYHQRRVMKDGQLIFFVNSDTIQSSIATIRIDGKSVVRMDLISGKCFQVPIKSENGKIAFDINLPPVGSSLYYVSSENLEEPQEKNDFKNEKLIESSAKITAHPEGDNVLVIDYMDIKSKNLNMQETYFMKGMYKLFEVNKFPMGNPWQHKIQFKQDYLALDTFKVGSGFEVSYHFNVAQSIDLKSLEKVSAVVERPELWKVYLNSELIEKSKECWIDREFYRFPIGDKLKKGSNILTIKADKMSVHAELMPVYIVGDFALKPLKPGFEITSGNISGLGSWKEKGYPFYSQKVSYNQKFSLQKGTGQYVVKLNKWNGTLAEVKICPKPCNSTFEFNSNHVFRSSTFPIKVTEYTFWSGSGRVTPSLNGFVLAGKSVVYRSIDVLPN
ncbi:MAG: glycosyl hydrolase [Bacteroidota bacterium]